MKVSVIVPIYNVEKYIYRCVESLLQQTVSDFELILVDDGSPDRCPIICDEYAVKDERIKVIHKKNGGLSDARNAGLGIASGEFVAFVDSDDWVAPNYLETLLRTIEYKDADICECEIVRTSGIEDLPRIDKEIVNSYSTVEGLKLLIEDNVLHQYVWNKLYRRSVLQDVFFVKDKTNEDEFWTYQVFGKAKKIVSTNIPLYFYYQRDDSIMGTDYSLKRLDAIEAKILRQEYIENNFPEIETIARRNLFGSCIYAGQMVLKNLHEEDKNKARKILNDAIKKCKISLKECALVEGRGKIWFVMAYFSFWGTCNMKNLMRKGF